MADVEDLTWMVEACGTDSKRMADVAMLLARAALSEVIRPIHERLLDRVSHYRLLVRELERRIKA